MSAAAQCVHETCLVPSMTNAEVCGSSTKRWQARMLLCCADKRAAQNMLDRDFGWVADPLFFGECVRRRIGS